MKLKLSLALVLIALASSANGAIFTFNNVATGPGASSGTGDTLYANSANALSSGTIVSVGYFPSGFDLSGNLHNQSTLLANYTIFTSVVTGSTCVDFTPAINYPGYTEYAPNDLTSITGADARIGLKLYSFDGNAATLAGSSQFSLFQVGTIGDDTSVSGGIEYVINPAGISPLIGTTGLFNGTTGDQTGWFKTLKTAIIVPIPEPSTALLGAIGVLGLLRRRRN